MADQAVRNGSSASKSPLSDGVIGGVGSFGTGLATLAVLQLRLAICDLRESTRTATPLIVGLIACGTIGLAGTTVGLLGLALWLASVLDFSPGVMMMIVAVVGLLVAGIVSMFLARKLPASLVSFRRSQEELDRNLAWVKTTLVHSGR